MYTKSHEGLIDNAIDPTCLHNSLVGTRMTTLPLELMRSTRMRSKIGIKYAAVFPVPLV